MGRQPDDLTPYRSNRHFYGAEARRHREAAGLSLDGLARQIPYSKSQLHRVEKAEIMPPPGLSATLDEQFGTDRHFQRLYELVRQSPEIHPEQYRLMMQMETRARSIEIYSGEIVPGLLQTERYARALFRVTHPQAPEERIEELLAGRLGRQQRLHSARPPKLSVILSEAAVRRPVGGPAAMREQLTTILGYVDTLTTVVQLLPFSHGEHGLLGGELKLLHLGEDGTVAWEESNASGRLFEKPEDVTPRRDKYQALRSHALPPAQTADVLRTLMEELPE